MQATIDLSGYTKNDKRKFTIDFTIALTQSNKTVKDGNGNAV